jgi:hypothetical protein
MKERIGVLVGGAVEGMPWLGTFHSIGVKLLRRHAELAGLRSDFTIFDTDDVIRLVKQLIQAEGIDDKRWPARQFAQMIDGWKNKGLGPAEIPEGDSRGFANGKGRALYTAYQERLQTLNAVDFGDLLCLPIRMFRANPDVLKEYQKKVPLHPGRRVSGHQHRAIYVAAAPGPAAPPASAPTSAAWAMTTSRSMAGAARKLKTSCASRRISPAPRSSGSSATTAPPNIFSAPPVT